MNLLTGRERRLEGSEAGTGKHRHGGPGAELGNGSDPALLLKPSQDSEGWVQGHSGKFSKGTVGFYGKPGGLGQHQGRDGEGGGRESPGRGDRAHLGSDTTAVSTCWLCNLRRILKQETQFPHLNKEILPHRLSLRTHQIK